MDPDAFELFDMDSGNPAAFLGVGGGRGLLRWNGSQWAYFKPGSLEWDSAHQAVYRNHKAMTMTLAELEQRNIPPPPVEIYRRPVESVAWSDNFRASMPFNEIPPPVLAKLRGLPGTRATIFLVLFEDEYETALGDGCFLYPHAAFWEEAAATACLSRRVAEDAAKRTPSSSFGYRYRLKSVEIARDEMRDRIVADLKLAEYEHYSIEEVVKLLGAAG